MIVKEASVGQEDYKRLVYAIQISVSGIFRTRTRVFIRA